LSIIDDRFVTFIRVFILRLRITRKLNVRERIKRFIIALTCGSIRNADITYSQQQFYTRFTHRYKISPNGQSIFQITFALSRVRFTDRRSNFMIDDTNCETYYLHRRVVDSRRSVVVINFTRYCYQLIRK